MDITHQGPGPWMVLLHLPLRQHHVQVIVALDIGGQRRGRNPDPFRDHDINSIPKILRPGTQRQRDTFDNHRGGFRLWFSIQLLQAGGYPLGHPVIFPGSQRRQIQPDHLFRQPGHLVRRDSTINPGIFQALVESVDVRLQPERFSIECTQRIKHTITINETRIPDRNGGFLFGNHVPIHINDPVRIHVHFLFPFRWFSWPT